MDVVRNTVFLVDDSQAVRTALSRLVQTAGHLVRAFASAEEYLAAENTDVPGCLVLDVCLPGLSGLELQQSMIARGDERPIVFLTGRGNIRSTVAVMKSGAIDFLTKPVDRALLDAALAKAFQRDADNRAKRATRQTIQRRFESLTPRERAVMTLVVYGKLNKLIAIEMGTVEKTVKVHRGRMMAKMAATSVAELVHMGIQVGVSMEPAALGDGVSEKPTLHWLQKVAPMLCLTRKRRGSDVKPRSPA
jgi:FixJ family two-component response regulator